jgi:hypothetical protein
MKIPFKSALLMQTFLFEIHHVTGEASRDRPGNASITLSAIAIGADNFPVNSRQICQAC